MRITVKNIIEKYNNDKTRLMDILYDIQTEYGFIASEAVGYIAEGLGLSKVDVEQTRSFYHFFTETPVGEYAIYLNNSVVSEMMGCAEVAKAFEKEAGISFGEVTKDGKIGLHYTACIGMSDQEPAAIINDKVFTSLTPERVKNIVSYIKEGLAVSEMLDIKGDGRNSSSLINSMVFNNIRKAGPVLFSDYEKGAALTKISGMNPEEVIDIVKASSIRGRGGAGFPTGLKWQFCRQTAGPRYVLCNADEGEPGTFKERVLLTETAELLFEGMAIAGYAIDAKEGILYLRAEYRYLKAHLENVLAEMEKANQLGKTIAGKEGFDFNIRIQFGAGAYVCGEESALIESAEGKRGEPRNRPPFPVQKGYMDKPTVVNNVETLCSIVKIINNGAEWFTMMGSKESAGTKLLSVSGDCDFPGIYEIEWGCRVRDILEMVGAEDVQAIQIGGPSGVCIGPKDFKRNISFEDLATGGSFIIFGKDRNLIKDVVMNFTEFFIDESCGSCVPCRAITVLIRNKLQKIIDGNGTLSDLDDLKDWGDKMVLSNRCGLGQTAANPILTTLQNFREKYEVLINKDVDFNEGFDLEKAVQASCKYVERVPNL